MPCSIPLLFNDQTDIVFLRDVDVIKKLPVFCRALEGMGDDWESKNLDPTDSWVVPFPKWAAEFIFENISKYNVEENVTLPLDQFPEANRLSLDELKTIMKLCNFWELKHFMDCIGYVVANKLDINDINQMAQFFGVPAEPQMWFGEEDGWLHPPLAVYKQN